MATSMSFQGRSLDEREAASIVAGLHSNNTVANDTSVDVASAVGTKKRSHDNGNAVTNKKRAKMKATDTSVGVASAAGTKKRSLENGIAVTNEKRSKKKPVAAAAAAAASSAHSKKDTAKKKDPPMDATGLVFAQPELKPAPYFYYTDHSLEMDDDPLTPITAAGSVPTFPAKMHAILTNPELADVVGWAPHGRSWRILKPRDFEIRVLPKYFEHSKFSSFVRQANGWGFRRMSQGYDKNAYFHEYFLRAMPWLCKKMRRPKVAEKKAVDPEMEPDLDAISHQLPVPDRPLTREVLVLQKTIELGPKARMPVLWDTGTPPAAPSSPVTVPDAPAVENLSEVANLSSLDHSRSYGDLKPAALPNPPSVAVPAPQGGGAVVTNTMLHIGNNVQNNVQQFSENNVLPQNSMPTLNQNNLNAAFNYAAAPAARPSNPPNNTVGAPPSNQASDSHFAAGFMAATAYHSNQIQNMLSSAFMAGMPIPNNGNIANLGSAFEILQRAGMGQNNLHPQGNPAAAGAGGNSALNGGGGSSSINSQQSTLSEQAIMQRLQQFQAYQAHFQ